MGYVKNNQPFKENNLDFPREFTSQAGLKVKTSNDIWVIAPCGKGRIIDVSWHHRFNHNLRFRDTLLDVLIHYAETNAATTLATINYAIQSAFPDKDTKLCTFNRRWISFNDSLKKTLKGFFSTCSRLNHKNFKDFESISNKYKHKPRFNALHPTKGRLTDFEFDSILDNLRRLCDEIPKQPPLEINFYDCRQVKKQRSFVNYKGILCYRMMVQLARRPRQISFLKWCDVLPTGISFQNPSIHNEPLHTGIKSLHVRCFKIKQTGKENSFRCNPERWTIPLSESFSELLIRYKLLYKKGLSLVLNKLGNQLSSLEIDKLLYYCPIFPSQEIFRADYDLKQVLNTHSNEKSQLFHLSEGDITGYETSYGKGLSDRQGSVIGKNNRLRHTYLCNAALRGASLADISKITNVTLPSARYYLQLGLKERQFINENYAANNLLRKAFNPKPFISEGDVLIESEIVGAVGIERKKPTCQSCDHKKRMVRPIPCYGCANFVPLLEADHETILEQAQEKLAYLLEYGNAGSSERLKKAIKYIKLTITICHEILRKKNLLNNTKPKT